MTLNKINRDSGEENCSNKDDRWAAKLGVPKDKIDEICKADGRKTEKEIKINWLKCVASSETIKSFARSSDTTPESQLRLCKYYSSCVVHSNRGQSNLK